MHATWLIGVATQLAAPVQDPTITTGIEAMLVAAMCWLGS
jgi:hypothetical protein